MTKHECLLYPAYYRDNKCHENRCGRYLFCVRAHAPRFIKLTCPTCGNQAELIGDWIVHNYVKCEYCDDEMKG